ncbi:hypothetical protein GCM10010345_85530 [Streptomyces canarius]|uniref:Uncharacterized protein n=1 Tax=Streptomyces canarius TaxID=285453 RepID=A0ABQ3D9F8_9ACTN|nr:hypothetical protein GCM10010345_85530 [Streptomyces canarius]
MGGGKTQSDSSEANTGAGEESETPTAASEAPPKPRANATAAVARTTWRREVRASTMPSLGSFTDGSWGTGPPFTR